MGPREGRRGGSAGAKPPDLIRLLGHKESRHQILVGERWEPVRAAFLVIVDALRFDVKVQRLSSRLYAREPSRHQMLATAGPVPRLDNEVTEAAFVRVDENAVQLSELLLRRAQYQRAVQTANGRVDARCGDIAKT